MSLITTQLGLDFQLSAAELEGSRNIFIAKTPQAAARFWARDEGDIVIRDNRLLVRVTNPEALIALKQAFGEEDGAWFLSIANLTKLATILSSFDLRVSNMAPFFVPSQRFVPNLMPQMHLIEADEIPAYQVNRAIAMAFSYDRHYPGRLGVAYHVDGELKAIAGASQNGDACWEISVEILDPQYRHRGIAAQLVKQLTATIQSRRPDILPVYGTQFSHVQSMNVAIRAGFVLGWTELMIGKC
ncbi:GNAT family N-acetyltransferase [Lacticaseibacillus chiayiensis]|uniref:GNAT family N-acetyltransferase n=1 Tax=Lacticaseibacillus chiayiensis TaxID=2100821 RepID=UPI0010118E9B|nr:GNAT family N-acetyltransferase [Lacticaseibacillus chiayiensis]RXT57810.1 GNAT family N-acetyltransferase [Lacticaseibacillus chiayiensis]